MTTTADAIRDDKLTNLGIPIDPDLRILALSSFANRFGAGTIVLRSLVPCETAGGAPGGVASRSSRLHDAQCDHRGQTG